MRLVAGLGGQREDHLPGGSGRVARALGGPALLPASAPASTCTCFEAGRKLVLCGVDVPHDRGLAGHSDADVGIHALCDAIYGALAEGDIGRHFPPSEATWKDADSARFLRHAGERIAARGGRLANADVTLICERPKITPHRAGDDRAPGRAAGRAEPGASRSRRRPPNDWASPAAAKASPPRRSRRCSSPTALTRLPSGPPFSRPNSAMASAERYAPSAALGRTKRRQMHGHAR